MAYSYEDIRHQADEIKKVIGDFVPEILLILGSGKGLSEDSIENPVYYDYENIPFIHKKHVDGHKSRFAFGTIEGRRVVCMQGRIHFYEGYSMQEIGFMIRLCHLLGAQTMLLTNASGSINKDWNPGDIMIIEDHIKLFEESPLRGDNDDEFGPRFCDMSHTYDPELIELAQSKASDIGLQIRKGVYIMFAGPQFETPAEIRAARILGADAVGMSTVPDVIAARHCGMRILGMALISNMAAGITGNELSAEEVTVCSEQAGPKFDRLLRACIREM